MLSNAPNDSNCTLTFSSIRSVLGGGTCLLFTCFASVRGHQIKPGMEEQAKKHIRKAHNVLEFNKRLQLLQKLAEGKNIQADLAWEYWSYFETQKQCRKVEGKLVCWRFFKGMSL